MANHHIISHTGVVSTWELLRGAVNTFNLGFDMALLTVIAATLSGGDPVTWTLSIGGPDPRVEAPLGGLLGLLGALFFFFFFYSLLSFPSSTTARNASSFRHSLPRCLPLVLWRGKKEKRKKSR